MKRAKHVIILGAGASASSGYPVANGLRLWMSSAKPLRERIERELADDPTRDKVLQQFDFWIKPTEHALQLFREGAFATLDEFCRLAGTELKNEVRQLRKILRLALSVHNPEDEYEKSDYYAFVQRLFHENLVDLRDDIAVLSFNYDVYLEFLLQRAARVRETVTKHGSKTDPDLLTSGFTNRNTALLEESDGFCSLKLHGAIAWPALGSLGNDRDHYCWYGDLFEGKPAARLQELTSGATGQSDSPIVFPWEIMDDTGTFVEQEHFPCRDAACKGSRFAGSYNGTTTLFQLFKSLWTRARNEVLAANKISIVGLSLHDYLKPAFNFLFKGKTGNAEVVVADKYLEKFSGTEDSAAHFDPLSPVSRFAQMLQEMCPALRWNEPEGGGLGGPGLPSSMADMSRRPIRLRKSFEEFILTEMDPNNRPKGIILTSEQIRHGPPRGMPGF